MPAQDQAELKMIEKKRRERRKRLAEAELKMIEKKRRERRKRSAEQEPNLDDGKNMRLK